MTTESKRIYQIADYGMLAAWLHAINTHEKEAKCAIEGTILAAAIYLEAMRLFSPIASIGRSLSEK